MLLLALLGTPAAGGDVRIVEPLAETIAYGPTRILVELRDPRRLGAVHFFLDEYPRPICVVTHPPFECAFDAGTTFQGRRLRVAVVADDGTTVAEASLETTGFPRPERVVRYTLTVPVVALAVDDRLPRLVPDELRCRFGGEACRVVEARRLSESARWPVSLEILVDVSGSVRPDRWTMLEALREILDGSPLDIEVSLAEFSGGYRRLCDFTNDRNVLDDAMRRLAAGGGKTCLLTSLQVALRALAARPGHRALFVISDGLETCQLDIEENAGGREVVLKVESDFVADVVLLARHAGIPIYVFTVGDGKTHGVSSVDGRFVRWQAVGTDSFQAIAAESGGRDFRFGELHGLGPALGRMVRDLEGTWIVDVDLPRRFEPGKLRRFELVPVAAGIELRHPDYWSPLDRVRSLVAHLEHADPAMRRWAAGELAAARHREAMAGLLRALAAASAARERAAMTEAIRATIAALLLHGERGDQIAGLDAVAKLADIDRPALDALQPVFDVFRKTGPPRKLLARLDDALAIPHGPS